MFPELSIFVTSSVTNTDKINIDAKAAAVSVRRRTIAQQQRLKMDHLNDILLDDTKWREFQDLLRNNNGTIGITNSSLREILFEAHDISSFRRSMSFDATPAR
jgi:hypothetical protein